MNRSNIQTLQLSLKAPKMVDLKRAMNNSNILQVDLNVDLSNTSSSAALDGSCYYTLGEVFVEKLYNLVHQKANYSEHLSRGHYLLPFRLALPKNLPSSFHFCGFGVHGRIIYTLEVEVLIPGLLRKSLKSEPVEVGINEANVNQIMPLQMVHEFYPQTLWCTIGSVVEVAVALDKNFYSPGDRVNLKFAVNCGINSKKLKFVQVALIRHVRCGPPDRCRTNQKLLGRVKTGQISGCLERRAVFMIPENEPVSVKGRLIECYYELVFTVRPEWSFATSQKFNLIVNETFLPTYDAALTMN